MTKDEAIEVINLLDAFIAFNEIEKIISSFIIPLEERSILKEDGHYYIHGNFNIGGTVSGRLSSSKINLQNLPSGGTQYAQIIKECFIAPNNYIFVGADYDSLEDKVSALTTRDPNKIKVYSDGFDGHSLRAFYYFPEQLPGIVNTVASINTIEKLYPEIRQNSKAPTFALTYQGTWHTLVNKVGMPKDKAIEVERNYHELYKVSDEWVQTKLEQATIDGYVTCAFGLRVRTPILSQVVLNSSSTPTEAAKEGRTAGNALGQSYGMLNQRSTNEFMDRVYNSPYKYQIHPKAQIHDAAYFDTLNKTATLKWVNDNLVECMNWTGLPELQHPDVSLGGKLHVYYPTWDTYVKLPNNAKSIEINKLCKEHQNEYTKSN